MDDGCCCPICFGEYGSSGEHRIVSMKCGHLFGQSCILGWFGKKKRAICPTCTVSSTLSQVRIIFASKITALGSENEQKLLDKFVEENKEKNLLIQENKNLKAQIDCLKLELSRFYDKSLETEDFKIHHTLKRQLKITNPNKIANTHVIIDEIKTMILISGVKDDKPAIYRYSSQNFDFMSVFKFENKGSISNIVSSPFKDGLALVSINTVIYLLNTYSFCMIFWQNIMCKITAISFSKEDKNILLVGDEDGNLRFINTECDKVEIVKVCDNAIHSIGVSGGLIYVSSVFKIYTVNYDDLVVQQSDIPVSRICTNMFVHNNSILTTSRLEDNTVDYFIKDTNCFKYTPQYKQIRRQKDKLVNEHLFLVDDKDNALAVHNLNNFDLVHKYEFKEVILDFCIGNSHTVVLTPLYIYVYM